MTDHVHKKEDNAYNSIHAEFRKMKRRSEYGRDTI
jgi:hypothetical protein